MKGRLDENKKGRDEFVVSKLRSSHVISQGLLLVHAM
jgi:hypothetical protein